MVDYDRILKVISDANEAWAREEKNNPDINHALEHLELVLREVQKIPSFTTHKQREVDFFSSVGALIRCALHYKALCHNGCFDDARFFQRKALEYFAVMVSIGYCDDLYNRWTKEEFTRPGKGFSYLVKLLLRSSKVPPEEKQYLKLIIGNSEIFPGKNQYHFLSNESVHGLSSKVLRSQVKDDLTFNLDIRHIKEEVLHIKMLNVVVTILMAVNVILGVFKYSEYIRNHRVTPEAEKIKSDHEDFEKKLINNFPR